MKYLYTILSLLFLSLALQAEESTNERVYVYTDKECYVAGESILVKFLVINQNFRTSGLSKVGYVEICDTERPQIQLKLALENGAGNGKMKIPRNIPTGIYQLSGYTRYMRNEGENIFFKRQIAIINPEQPIDKETVLPAIQEEKQPDTIPPASEIRIQTDQNSYTNRDKVQLTLNNIPENIIDLVVSVYRNDSMAFLPGIDRQEWTKQVTRKPETDSLSKWIPEYEGHIITGRMFPHSQGIQAISSIAFVGKDIRYTSGQMNPDEGTTFYYTNGIYGPQEIVTTLTSNVLEKTAYRMDLVSPFCEYLPKELPVLQIHPNKKYLTERYIAVQLEKETTDTLNRLNPVVNYYKLPVFQSFNFDQYTRFETLSETILEFIGWVRVSKVNGKRKIKVFMEEEQRFNTGNTLVLLDGIPIFDHEEILNYNPKYIEMFKIYTGRYAFGGHLFEGIVSLTTHQGNLPFFQLGQESQLFKYDCPSLPLTFETPDYGDEMQKKSRKPDFRHTLYWNASVKADQNRSAQSIFYTSDLSGSFNVVVEGITSDGKIVQGTSHFEVKEKE